MPAGRSATPSAPPARSIRHPQSRLQASEPAPGTGSSRVRRQVVTSFRRAPAKRRIVLPRLSAEEDPPDLAHAVKRARRRPVAVTLVGLLAVGVGLYHAVDGIIILTRGGSASKLSEGAVDLALGVLALAIGRGAFRMARWSWAAFMTWAVIGLDPSAPAPFLLHRRELRRDGRRRGDRDRAHSARHPDRVRGPPSAEARPRSWITGSRRRQLTSTSFGRSSPSCTTRTARSSFRWTSSRTSRASSLWLHVPEGTDEEVVPEGSADPGPARRAARGAVRLALLPPLRPSARPDRERLGPGRRAPPRAGAGKRVQGRPGPARARRPAAAARRRAVLALAAAARHCPRGDRRRRGPQVRRDPKERRTVRVPGPGRPAKRLDGLPVLVLLRLQPLALGLPRRQRPRIGLGDDLGLPLRGRSGARPGLGRLRVARLPRRRPPAPLGRPRRPGARGRAPGRLRRRRLARGVLPSRRVPGRGADPGAAADQAPRRGARRLLAHPPRPGRRDEAAAANPVRRLRPRRRPLDRPRPGARVDAERDRRVDAVGRRVPRPLGPLRARPDLRRERAGRPDVRPGRLGPPLLVRSPRLRRASPR